MQQNQTRKMKHKLLKAQLPITSVSDKDNNNKYSNIPDGNKKPAVFAIITPAKQILSVSNDANNTNEDKDNNNG